MDAPKKQGSSGKIPRDSLGRFPPGVSGNPAGKPAFSITTLVREELQKVPDGSDKTKAQQFIEKILEKAIIEGDVQMQKSVWAYMDGLPREHHDITSGGKPIPLFGVHGISNNNSDKKDSGDAQADQSDCGGDECKQDN